MSTVVAYTWARDPGNAAVRDDGTVDWRNTRTVAGDDDPAAMAVGLRVAGGSDLVGLTLGDGDASWGLARGAARALQVTDAPTGADDAVTAALLAAGVREIGDVEVVVVGDSERHPGVAATLAGLLGWPALVGVADASLIDGRLSVVRTAGDVEETVSVPVPAVLGVAAASAESRVPGMKELLAARKRPVTKTTVAELGVTVPAAPELVSSRRPERQGARVFTGEAAQVATELVAALRADGVLS
ncbi:MAG: electron transfer flavoprotein subunit alpha [Actinobacteria bacterium]|nr:electron transfer flavoprotein subunit alpha [Actinomycetota bacterium]MCG2800712.1 hypothetical protein [Cellulomonas sp.]